MTAPVAAPSARRASLTQHLLLWSLGALVAVWGSFVFMGYQTGVHEADELTDGHLASVASLLLNLRAFESVEGVHATQRAPLPGLKAHDYQQSLSVVQWSAEGRVVAASGSAPPTAGRWRMTGWSGAASWARFWDPSACLTSAREASIRR